MGGLGFDMKSTLSALPFYLVPCGTSPFSHPFMKHLQNICYFFTAVSFRKRRFLAYASLLGPVGTRRTGAIGTGSHRLARGFGVALASRRIRGGRGGSGRSRRGRGSCASAFYARLSVI
jgi:hypothetical protein